ncbi:unnamed protein product [Rotaria sp. Silwood1]|nr:unnamed protein product [Rotaria sp. Silwood1]CAF1247138.1 unnamed protein product [Rotaria sp. Silwood1]CAF1607478.1 unnamed protein product [Rotaria sp. Silwood1]CAF1621212.1 unnamed protein product [Rotaria sp. Silwood1]CAF3742011.1 unnamed protein product [Rotaria sp. Silwood1]
MGAELFYLFGRENPDVIVLRWLRARKWHVPHAVQFMMDTLKWRHEWGLQRLMGKGESDLIKEECASGKIYSMGKDKAGRPITYVHTKEHIKGQYPLAATEKLIIFSIETARLLIEPPVEQGTIVIDMLNVGLQNLDYQHIKFMINVVQNYYPECLGIALVVNAPWTFNTVWNVIKSWLDPVVASKIHFVKSSTELAEYINPMVLPKRLGGNQMDFEFNPPKQEDEVQVNIFRKDKEGMEKVQLEHREAAQHYINMTLKWATIQTQDEEYERLNRVQAAKRLSATFEQLVPYVSTRTHFHRTGEIQEPIFDMAYNRTCAEISDTSS